MTRTLQVYKAISTMDETDNLHWLGEISPIPPPTKVIGQIKDIWINPHYRNWVFLPRTTNRLRAW